jgi:hypothetical protein
MAKKKTQQPTDGPTIAQDRSATPEPAKPPRAVHGPAGPRARASARDRLAALLNLKAPSDNDLFESAVAMIEELSNSDRDGFEDRLESNELTQRYRSRARRPSMLDYF